MKVSWMKLDESVFGWVFFAIWMKVYLTPPPPSSSLPWTPPSLPGVHLLYWWLSSVLSLRCPSSSVLPCSQPIHCSFSQPATSVSFRLSADSHSSVLRQLFRCSPVVAGPFAQHPPPSVVPSPLDLPPGHNSPVSEFGPLGWLVSWRCPLIGMSTSWLPWSTMAASATSATVCCPSGIFSYTPEPHVAFCPIFVHPLFPLFEPHIQKWVIFVRRRPCVCDTFRFESPPSKRSILAPTFSSFPPRTTTHAGQKQLQSVIFEKVSPAEPATPSQEHGLCPPLGFQPPFLLNIAGRRPAMFSRKAGWRSKGGGLGV